MMDIKLTLQWHGSLDEWRVTGSDGVYAGAADIGDIPNAVRIILRSEAAKLELAAK